MNLKFANFVDLLRYRAEHQSDKTAFIFLSDGETESSRISYKQLDQQAQSLAFQLQSLKAEGERALLLYQPGLEFISVFLGCLYGGVVAVPAYPPRANRSLERLQAIVSDAEAKLILTTASLLTNIEGRLTDYLSQEIVQCVATDTLELASAYQPKTIRAEQLSFLQYTSGSTGTPKGVMVSHGNLIDNSALINTHFGDTDTSVGLSWLPQYHDMGLIGGILQSIYVGATTVLMPPVTLLQRPIRLLQTISKYGITSTGGPNFFYDLCVNQTTPEQRAGLDLSSWTLAFCGAETVRSDTLMNFQKTFAPYGFSWEAFLPCYGMAEATLIVTGSTRKESLIQKSFQSEGLKHNQVIEENANAATSNTLVSCGRVHGGEVIIVNPETLEPCSSEQVGEIWVNNNCVTQGYWQRPHQTEATFHAHLATGEPKSFLRTGDLGFMQAGELFVTGRLKDLIIIRGRNHYPQDIELTVENSHPSLRSGCGAAFSVERDGQEQLIIVQEVKRDYLRKLDSQAVIKDIRKAVIQIHEVQPDSIILLKTGTIPKTSSGKIQHYACKKAYLEGELSPIITSPKQPRTGKKPKQAQTGIQQWLITKIAEKTGLSAEDINPQESWSSYGLDSLDAVKLSAELEDWLGQKLSPTLVYDYPTLEALAQYLEAGNPEALRLESPKITAAEIAIVGMGCRFPQAQNLEEFWQLLHQGRSAISEKPGLGWGGFLAQLDGFDAQFFGISEREAQEMDPQQRLLLEVTWEALENAAIAADSTMGSPTGVFIALSSYDYSQLRIQKGLPVNPYVGTGNAHSIGANRLSYWFDWHGPSLTVDTACSSSLVALHLAVKSLQAGECQRAVVGAVNVLLSPELTETFNLAGMMAKDGLCKTFDEKADGYVRSEGCGVIVLEPLKTSQEKGHPILAVIRGTAINQDGRSNGLTAPNGPAQQRVICQALAQAGVQPSQVSYIETHGTGTALGDPIEVTALQRVFAPERAEDNPLWLGSVKTNIGHLEAASGMAGLIKVVLALQAEEIPPHLHLDKLNPHIDLAATPISIPTLGQPWPRNITPRLAGVSSFGFGGTNAHVIVAEGISPQLALAQNQRPYHLLTLSAKTPQALTILGEAYQEYLTNNPNCDTESIAYSTQIGRSHFAYRQALLIDNKKEVRQVLEGVVKPGKRPKLAFLFTGQGSQYGAMGQQLYTSEPTFRQALLTCGEILNNYLDKPLEELLCGAEDLSQETVYTQPLLFALEYALAQVWLSWGIRPQVVLGHSVGEYVAACIAGVFSLEEGLKLISQRGKLMHALPKNGAMVAIFADEERIRSEIEPYGLKIAIAALNGDNTVISGEQRAIESLMAAWSGQGLKMKPLKVSHGFHSPLMQPMLAEFLASARRINYHLPEIPIISNLNGEEVQEEITKPEYWVEHIIKPVRFAASLEKLRDKNIKIFLEIGPQPILLGMGRSWLRENSCTWLPSLRRDREDWYSMLESLAHLYNLGMPIAWEKVPGKEPPQVLTDLPTYPFQRQRHWLESTPHLEELYHPSWQKLPSLPSPKISQDAKPWLIVGGEHLGTEIRQILENLGQKATQVLAEDLSWEQLADSNQILDLSWGNEQTCQNWWRWGQTNTIARLWGITRGARTLFGETVDLQGARLWGLGKTWALERDHSWGGLIDLAPNPEPEEAQKIVAEIFSQSGELAIAFRGGERYGERLERYELPPGTPKIDYSEGIYLITGGLGSLGLRLAQWLGDRGAKSLVLLGRKQPTDKSQRILDGMEAKGISINIALGDVADLDWLKTVIAPIQTNLKGVFHLAGSREDGLLENLKWEQFERVWSGKITGAWNLHLLTRDLPLDSFVLFSSAASLLGSPFQANYASANSFLDALAHYRHSLGLKGLSINWGAFTEGMGESEVLAVKGLKRLEIPESLALLPSLLAANIPQVGVLSVDWSVVLEQFPLWKKAPFLKSLGLSTTEEVALITPKEQWLSLPPSQQNTFLENYLRSQLAKVLGLSADSVSGNANLLDLGMDSLRVMELINKLKEDWGLMLYPREFYERPHWQSLALYLQDLLRGGKNMETQTLATPATFAPLNPLPPILKKLPPVAFLLSAPRSGSTLLRVMLAGHPQLVAPPELHLLPFNTMGERAQVLGLSHLGEGLPRAIMELQGLDARSSLALVTQWEQEDRSIAEVYATLQGWSKGKLLVDKSPTYGFDRQTLERAEQLFDKPKYIYLVRHPYSVIESFVRLRMDKLLGSASSDPYALAELIWRQSNENIMAFCEQVGLQERCYRLDYEHLVQEPETMMRSVSQFLEIPFVEAMVHPYSGERMTDGVHPQSLGVGDPNFTQRQQIDARGAIAWREIDLPLSLGEKAKVMAGQLGYELPKEIQVSQPDDDDTWSESFQEVKGLRLCLCEWGEEVDAPLVVCLHGILEQGAVWHPLAQDLVRRGYRVVAPDLRGHGKSDHLPVSGSYNLLDFVSDLAVLSEDWLGKPFVLLGHSYGSMVAALFASLYPERVSKLVLVEPILPTPLRESETLERLKTHFEYLAHPPVHGVFPDIATAAASLRLSIPSLSGSLALALAERILEPVTGGLQWRWDVRLRYRTGSAFGGLERSGYLALLGQLSLPLTLIYGDKSEFNRPEDLALMQQVMTQGKRVILSGGHYLPLEVPRELARVLM